MLNRAKGRRQGPAVIASQVGMGARKEAGWCQGSSRYRRWARQDDAQKPAEPEHGLWLGLKGHGGDLGLIL